MTTTTSARAGTSLGSGEKSSSSQLIAKPNVETTSPLTMNGSARPRKSAGRFAGVARIGESVWYWRSFAIPIVIP